MGRTLCVVRFNTVRKAYGSVSFPSTFTVLPRSGCDSMRSASSERLNSCASMSRSCRSRVFIPWKSTAGWGSNHSNSTSTVSMSCHCELCTGERGEVGARYIPRRCPTHHSCACSWPPAHLGGLQDLFVSFFSALCVL